VNGILQSPYKFQTPDVAGLTSSSGAEAAGLRAAIPEGMLVN